MTEYNDSTRTEFVVSKINVLVSHNASCFKSDIIIFLLHLLAFFNFAAGKIIN